jgi:hypothetical protein
MLPKRPYVHFLSGCSIAIHDAAELLGVTPRGCGNWLSRAASSGAWKLGMIWVFEEVLLDVLPPARPRGYHGHKRQRRRKPSI